MTQPVQEPSTDRALQGFAFARDQIFRRPAPTSTGPLPLFRATQTTDVTTVEADGLSYAEVEWDCWENCAPDVFEEDLNIATGNVETVQILEAGVYAITVRIVFADTFSGNFRIIINDWGDYPLAAYYDHNNQIGQNGEQPAFSVVRTYPPPYCLEIGDNLPEILIQVNQWSASDVDTEPFGSTLEIVQLGSLGQLPCSS